MKRSFLFLLSSATALIAASYGLIRLTFGLYLPEMQADLGFDAGNAGWITSAASLVYCVGAAIGFALGTRAPRSLLLAVASTAAIGTWGMAAAQTLPLFAAAAVLSSAAAGLASPALVEILNRNSPATQHDRAQTIANAGTGPGLVAAGALALVILPAWRTGWLIAGTVAVVATALVLTLDREPSTPGTRPTLVPPADWWRAHRVPITAALLLGTGSAAVWSYGRSLLVDNTPSGDDAASTIAWIALGIGGTTVLGTARWLTTRSTNTAWALTAGAAGVGTLLLLVTAGHLPTALLACALFGWGYTAATGVLIAWTTRIDAARAPTGTAALFVTLVLGQAVGSAGVGALASGVGLTVGFVVAGVVACGSGAIAPLSSPRAPRASTP